MLISGSSCTAEKIAPENREAFNKQNVSEIRLEDALVNTLETVETGETVETVETAETVEMVETVETVQLYRLKIWKKY